MDPVEEDEFCSSADFLEILKFFDVARIVVGHTTMSDRTMKTRCGGRIVFTDVIMSEWSLKADFRHLKALPAVLVLSLDDGVLLPIKSYVLQRPATCN